METFAKELKGLWEPGFIVDGITYRVALVNGIFDGKGLELVSKTRGSCSLEGCNTCNFSGYSFGVGKQKSIIYPFYNSYLHEEDTRRLKRPLNVEHARLMYNIRTEINPSPMDRNYDDYIRDGNLYLNRTDESIKHVNGVKGVWAFDILPYAAMILKTKDRMHTSEHVVVDALRVFSRSKDSHTNRSQKQSVATACSNLTIFPCLYTKDIESDKLQIPWLLNKSITDLHDIKLKCVIGACSSEIPKKIFKKRKGRNTHESIMYGANGWARWCLHSADGEESTPYVNNKLKLFEIVRILNSARIKLSDVADIRQFTIDALVEHAALFPPCEQTYTLHELIHEIDQIPKLGPPKFNNLFGFERVNATLKRMIKNRCNSMPSIAKAYAVNYINFVHH